MERTPSEFTIEPAFAKSMEARMQPYHAWIERWRERGALSFGINITSQHICSRETE